MPTNKIIKNSDALGIGYGPGFAGIKVDEEDNVLQFNPDGTMRTVVDLSSVQTISGAKTFSGNIAQTGDTTILKTQTITAASISAAQYNVRSGITLTPSTSFAAASNLLTPLRGDITLTAAKAISTGYFYGVSGRFTGTTGSITGSGACIAGVNGKVDLGTLALSIDVQSSGVWADIAGTPTGAGLVQINAVRATNSGGATINSFFYSSGAATYWAEVANAAAGMYLAAGTSANSAGKSDGCAAQKVLKILTADGACYIPVFTQNS